MEPQYTVLARRFRPQTFSEVIGQERVAKTLCNAIHEGRVAHAYLFTGARGVGKTSMARIFAKALNCPNAKDGVPCNECEQCRGISVGQDVDVSEIDGASNRGIDDIRSLRANVSIKSMRSRYKVYIIDEVHMLTKEAFNALLKTLEEPPPMVKFIFCTTEPNKVPDTILSRCQRFDFGTISTDGITTRLRQLAEIEGFQVEEAALELVARRAAGSMRDSQSLFDQLLAFGAEQITSADVHRLLGTAPDERLIELVDAMIERRSADALMKLESALLEGVQLEALTDQLISYFRDLMIAACGASDVPLLSLGSQSRAVLSRQSSEWGLKTIIAAMQILADAKARMARVSYGRVLAELALVRISTLEDLDQLDDLIAQLKGAKPVVATLTAASKAGVLPSSGPKSLTSTPNEVPSEPAQKKSHPSDPVAIAPVGTSTSNHEFQQPAVEMPAPVIDWKTACGKDLHRAIIDRLNDMTGTYLQRTSAEAIIGPNILEFSLPLNYDVERRALDRPETVKRLEAIATELVGNPIRIRFKTVEAVETRTTPSPAAASSNRMVVVEEPKDPFVTEITKTFDVKSWKVIQELIADTNQSVPETAEIE